jgi:hypothetical protein
MVNQNLRDRYIRENRLVELLKRLFTLDFRYLLRRGSEQFGCLDALPNLDSSIVIATFGLASVALFTCLMKLVIRIKSARLTPGQDFISIILLPLAIWGIARHFLCNGQEASTSAPCHPLCH